ncbi:MAG: hypothetical protein RJB59_887, partial [Actinomycetota bacterium]
YGGVIHRLDKIEQINNIDDIGLDDDIDSKPIHSIKFQSTKKPFYVLVIKHECQMHDGFRCIKELIMQMHNQKMMDAYDTLQNNNIQIHSVKTDCFTIKADDLEKTKSLLDFNNGFGSWRLSKTEDIIYPYEKIMIKQCQTYSPIIPTKNDIKITNEWDTDEICEQFEKHKRVMVRAEYAGCGKSYACKAMEKRNHKVLFVCPTNKLVQNNRENGITLNMFFGVGILKVKGLFRKLRKLALRYGGVVVFFDEADALGNRGIMTNRAPGAYASDSCRGVTYLSQTAGDLVVKANLVRDESPKPASLVNRFMMGAGAGGGAGTGTLQALLTELSGLKKPRGFFNRVVRRTLGMRPKNPPKYRILVVMATNMPESLDEALLRPGRIDRMYRVGYPSKAGRIRTYEGYLAKVSHLLSKEEIEKLAIITPYATGATIKDLINESLIMAIRNGRDTVTWQDVLKAKQLKQLGPSEDVEYIERERHATAVHEACHAVMAYRVRRHMDIDIATIEKGAEYLGMVASIPPDDQFTHWKSEYEGDILVSLASLAGERMFFDGDNSSGVSGDLESATTIAGLMEGYWGMGSTVSSYASGRRMEIGAPGGVRPNDAKQEMRRALSDRIEDNLASLLRKSEELLRQDRVHVLAVAHALETHKTLSGNDVHAVIEGRKGDVVDGSKYLSPENIAAIEAYHLSALAAHKAHKTPEVALPELI